MERFQREAKAFFQNLYEEERKVLVFGEGRVGAPVMMIGEAPGEQESLQGRPFVGKAGKNLDAFLAEAGLVISGLSPDGTLVETVELPSHPFFIGVQFHPEFKSRPNRPHPLFSGFLRAMLDRKQEGSLS